MYTYIHTIYIYIYTIHTHTHTHIFREREFSGCTSHVIVMRGLNETINEKKTFEIVPGS